MMITGFSSAGGQNNFGNLKKSASQAKDIVDLDLCFSTYQNANVGGINDEYIYSGRLDNLTTCYERLEKSMHRHFFD